MHQIVHQTIPELTVQSNTGLQRLSESVFVALQSINQTVGTLNNQVRLMEQQFVTLKMSLPFRESECEKRDYTPSDAMNQRLSYLSYKLDHMDGRLVAHETRVKALRADARFQQLTTVQQQFDAFKNEVSKKIISMEQSIQTMECQLTVSKVGVREKEFPYGRGQLIEQLLEEVSQVRKDFLKLHARLDEDGDVGKMIQDCHTSYLAMDLWYQKLEEKVHWVREEMTECQKGVFAHGDHDRDEVKELWWEVEELKRRM